MTAARITRARSADADEVATLIASAFTELDVSRWLIPDADQRERVLAANFRILVEHALRHGEVHFAADRSGVAVWVHHGRSGPPEPPDYDRRLAEACGEHTHRFRLLDEAFETHHPHGAPHHHLAFLAVRPGMRDSGTGSLLLRHHHEHLDRTGLPAYLEASSERSRTLYERHGYRCLSAPFHLPENGPPLWPMWRDPTTPEP
ncbi:GNAT family N-acetyltransferase [Saccharopolyspora rosea]|uniref:GNAT family N-acetyltransferase n=1 Tax=Saccharopolyspora rosea TaxID=524884 RepID=A0ABW3FNF9_9PSEU|nr:GNAT family N-acetyltransferase [Saccharopolyspora rosea]